MPPRSTSVPLTIGLSATGRIPTGRLSWCRSLGLDCDSLSVVVRRLWQAMPQDSLSGARRALVGARDRLVRHGLLVDRLRLEGPSAALDLGLAQLRVFERDHIVAEAVFLAVRGRLRR